MVDPHSELREYLRRLIDRFLHIRALRDQLIIISAWETPKRVEALNHGAYFFRLVRYTFARMILVELCKILLESEKRSLPDYLNKASDNCVPLQPTRFKTIYDHPDGGRYEQISGNDFQAQVMHHQGILSGYDDLLSNIKGRRDQHIAHTDSKYFKDSSKLFIDYPLKDVDIDGLLEAVAQILKAHYSYLFQGDLEMRISSARQLDVVLTNVRAFNRVWKDKRITRDSAIRVVEYKLDDFEPPVE